MHPSKLEMVLNHENKVQLISVEEGALKKLWEKKDVYWQRIFLKLFLDMRDNLKGKCRNLIFCAQRASSNYIL